MASLFSRQSRLIPAEKEKIRKKLAKYHYADEAMNEIVKIVENFKELQAKPDMYVFDNGEKHELLSLHGTFQLTSQGQMHNVSVRFWFTINFPVVPPVVYVIPNPGMQIKSSRYLAPNGKVFLPYLHNWAYPQSKLEYLIQILLLQFTDDPPTYERRSATREGRSPTHEGRSPSREGRSPTHEGRSPTFSCSPTTSTTPAPSYLSYLRSWFQTPATSSPSTIPPATSTAETATTRPNSSVVSSSAAAPITSRAPISLPAVSATRSIPSSADASTTSSLGTTATIASSITSATVTTSTTTVASVLSQPVSETCPGCSSLALVVEQQAAELKALTLELRNIRCIVEGQAHQNTSDAIDDSVDGL